MSAFIVSDETMHRVVWALARADALPSLSRDEVGRMLFSMNNAALRERYGDRYPEDFCDPENYTYEHRATTPAALYRAVACFLYQCSEGNVPNTPLYQLVEKVMHQLEATLTGDNSEHSLTRAEQAMRMTEDQPWDF